MSADSPLAVLGFRAANPTGYGRLIQQRSGKLIAIREELDATVDERRIDLCNSGFIAVDSQAPMASSCPVSATTMPRANTI